MVLDKSINKGLDVFMKKLHDVDNGFIIWLLDLLAININDIVKKMKRLDFNCDLGFNTSIINKIRKFDLKDEKINKDCMFKPEGFYRIKYNHRNDSKVYFKDMDDYLTMVLVNDIYILFIKYNYKDDSIVYFSLNNISKKEAEVLINDMIFVFKFLNEQYIVIN